MDSIGVSKFKLSGRPFRGYGRLYPFVRSCQVTVNINSVTSLLLYYFFLLSFSLVDLSRNPFCRSGTGFLSQEIILSRLVWLDFPKINKSLIAQDGQISLLFVFCRARKKRACARATSHKVIGCERENFC